MSNLILFKIWSSGILLLWIGAAPITWPWSEEVAWGAIVLWIVIGLITIIWRL